MGRAESRTDITPTHETNIAPAPESASETAPERAEKLRTPVYDEHTTSSEIESDIRHTRGEMDETLDALGRRLHPRHLFDELLEWFRSGEGDRTREAQDMARKTGTRVRDFGRSITRQIRRHPIPSALIGAGLGWLIFEQEDEEEERRRRAGEFHHVQELKPYSGSYVDARTGRAYEEEDYGEEWRRAHPGEGPGREEERPGWTESAQQGMGQAQERLSQAGESMKETFRGTTERAGEKAGEWRRRAGETAAEYQHRFQEGTQRFRARAGRMSQQMQHGYEQSRERLRRGVEEAPLAVGIGTLALGICAGLIIPRTRREDEMMGEAADELKGRVRETGEELMESGRRVVESAGEEAERQGISPRQIGEEVQQMASHPGEEARTEEHVAKG